MALALTMPGLPPVRLRYPSLGTPKVAEKYGYKRKEIAKFMEKDPAVVTRYLREKQSLALETESVMKILSEEPKALNVKTQV